ncbi:MAG: hypothetical protein ACTSW1_15005 [Candidatus Hodarchaeales archaeon]
MKKEILFLLGIIFSIIVFTQNPGLENLSTSAKVLQVPSDDDTYPDIYWEGSGNDNFSTAYMLGNYSRKNVDPLNVSTWSPDFYKILARPKAFLRVELTFNESFLYNETGHQVTDTKADIDCYLYNQSGSVVDSSTGTTGAEMLGPYYTTEGETLTIGVKISEEADWLVGAGNYSTLYNLTVIIDDIYEALTPNDKLNQITHLDDEVLPGYYRDLYLTFLSSVDCYFIYLMENTTFNVFLNTTIELDLVLLSPESVYDDTEIVYKNNTVHSYNGSQIQTYFSSNFSITKNGFYIIKVTGSPCKYSMNFLLFDYLEVNNDNNSAARLDTGYHTGLLTSEDDVDWFRFNVTQKQRVLVNLYYYTSVKNLSISLYESQYSSTTVLDPVMLGSSIRIGPYMAENDSTYYLRVSCENTYQIYYTLSLAVVGPDDIYEENDFFNTPYILPANEEAHYRPTVENPLDGMMFLQDDPDYYSVSLLPGDRITVQITFNNSEADLNLQIFNASGVLLAESPVIQGFREVEVTIYTSQFVIVKVSGELLVPTLAIPYNMTVLIDKDDDSFEANDYPLQAAPIAEGNYSNLISRLGNDDWYYFYLHENDKVNLSVTFFAEQQEPGYLNDLDIDVLHEDQSLAFKSHTLKNESISFTAPMSGKYFLDVVLITGYSNSYNISLIIDETDDEYEDNDVIGQARELLFTGNATKEIVTNSYENLRMRVEDDDYYKIHVPAGLSFSITLKMEPSDNLDIFLLNYSSFMLGNSTNSNGIDDTIGPLSPFKRDTYLYIRIVMHEGLSANYDLVITMGPEELFISTITVPPFTSLTIPGSKPLSPLDQLVPIAIGAGVVGAIGAAGIYGLKSTDLGSKIADKFMKAKSRGRKKVGRISGKEKPPG